MQGDDIPYTLRPACGSDFDFAWILYEEPMKPLTVDLLGRWNDLAQMTVVKDAVGHPGTSIIVIQNVDIGWLQVLESPDALYLAQLYIHADLQNHGIGTAIVQDLSAEARQGGKALTLDVMRNNRARHLYERLGFQVVGESEHKFEMRWRDKGET